MPFTLEAGIQALYDKAKAEHNTQSTARTSILAKYFVQRLAELGLEGAVTGHTIPGVGRDRKWDIGWEYDGKFRLAISLHSMLGNVGGSAPNRLDELMGEVVNIQLASPEIVTGYVMVFDESVDSVRADGGTWGETIEERCRLIAQRRPPSWGFGMIEAYHIIRVNFAKNALLVSTEADLDGFFEALVREVRQRNPGIKRWRQTNLLAESAHV